MPKRRRLKTSADVRRFLAHVINAMESGEMEPQLGSKLAFCSNVLLKAVENSTIENRLASLEEKFERRDHEKRKLTPQEIGRIIFARGEGEDEIDSRGDGENRDRIAGGV
jgi:hypothetical protein